MGKIPKYSDRMNSQPFVLRSKEACEVSQRCFELSNEFLTVPHDHRGGKQSNEQFSARWAQTVELYLQVLGQFLWNRSPEIERTLRAVQLYALAVGIARPVIELPYFEEAISAEAFAGYWIWKFDLAVEDVGKRIAERVKEIKQERAR